MKIKRFTARDLPTATHMIKEEFGLAAIILSQKELPPDQGGGVEITAGVRDEDMPRKAPADDSGPGFASVGRKSPSQSAPEKTAGEDESFDNPPPERPHAKPKAGQAMGAAAYRRASTVLAEPSESMIMKEMENLGGTLGREIGELKSLILDLAHRQSLAEKWRDRPDLVSLYRRLIDTGLTPEHSRALVEIAAESAQAWGGEVMEHLRKAMRPKLRIADLSIGPPKYLALVGPSGMGKTTTLVNLAAFYRQRGLKVAAITLDTLRLGAAEQLTQYARILGLGVRVCQNHNEFNEAREIFEGSDLVLIDTPSRGFQKKDGRQELVSYFDEAKASTLLVLSAAMKENDLAACLNQGRTFREAGLVITKFDETESLGSLIGFVISQTPRLAFFTLGPKTSEDFVMANPDKLMELWLGDAMPKG
ncbi:flagellar biosynthesis protein FlhF [Deltaproteobacteria bacterium Smac51]|nr:flagellar biosynthesis protein FlhF [Deltaproteobacteria bacterium Smac51]